ncbi:DUF6879 family protein [Streptomyces sp. NBC_01803]|uniref:DUF6879 family protein n=1 Tax=Streptomyces sp. NBC_01803 TaxID=2975946 RepID=UPI002DD9D1EA|nr:DUF6879 family protein [Streptomyces sp. NBC_01803]WSA43436.1 hypothetical protein OIE51_04035 [Streptomyces sp. NBC_01803]
MPRRLRLLGSTSGIGDCPTLYEDLETGEVLVQGQAVTDAGEVAQLKAVKEGEGFVVVPRRLLADFAPRTAERTPEFVPQEQINEFVNDGFEHTAWRLETRTGYLTDQRMPSYEEFLRTGDTAGEVGHPWFRNVRRMTGNGKRFERVRLVDDPLTTGQRYLLACGRTNVVAGEDIRCMWRSDAERLGLNLWDFWLFDSRTVARFHFEGERTIGMELITEPAEVLRACQVRDAAWHHAVPYEEFEARVPSAE